MPDQIAYALCVTAAIYIMGHIWVAHYRAMKLAVEVMHWKGMLP